MSLGLFFPDMSLVEPVLLFIELLVRMKEVVSTETLPHICQPLNL